MAAAAPAGMMSATMSIRRLPLVLVSAFLAVACSKTDAKHSDHPLAGYWSPEGMVGDLKVGIEFDAASDKVMTHVDGPDGHDHYKGTYVFDAAKKTVTVRGKLIGDAKADAWTGTVAGETLTLTGGADTLRFKKGGKAH